MTTKSSLPLIAICLGSQSDWSTMKVAADILDQFGHVHFPSWRSDFECCVVGR